MNISVHIRTFESSSWYHLRDSFLLEQIAKSIDLLASVLFRVTFVSSIQLVKIYYFSFYFHT